MKKNLLVLMVMICTAFGSHAQDIHFTQFYASPLTLNPALTGVNDCNYRVALNYRSQWHSVTPTTTFKTPALSFDINNLAARYIKTGTLSAGLLMLNDKAGDGNLSNFTIEGSAGYLYSFDSEKKYSVSVGLQTGYVQKKLDATLLFFEEQFDGENFQQGWANGEQVNKWSFGYLDMNTGLVFLAHLSPKYDFYAGAAAFHLIQPKETFYPSTTINKLNTRGVIHAGGKIQFNDTWSLMPSVLYMGQTKASEINFGTNLGYHVSNANMEANVYFGGYYRLGDAVNLLVGGEYKKVRLGLSYDVNISTLNTATNSKGGFEISLGYTGCIGGLILDPPILWCPRF